MKNWLLSLPKAVLVFFVLSGAVFFVIVNDPPHTICHTQIENFKSQQIGFIYEDPKQKSKAPKAKHKKKTLFETLLDQCKKSNSPGSCYGLFSKTRQFIKSFKVVSEDCYNDFSSLAKVKNTLFQSYILLIRLAWGGAPPVEYQDKLGWLSKVDMAFFCLVKEQIIFYYGTNSLLNLEKKTFEKLPGAKNMQERTIREISIVSENCTNYPRL